MLVRDLERGEQARARIEERLQGASGRLEIELCDISDLADVRRFAGRLSRATTTGSTSSSTTPACCRASGGETADGVELTFATNVLGPFLLTGLLLPGTAARRPVARDHRLLGRDVHGPARRQRPTARAPRVRRRALLRPHQARRGRAQPPLGRAPSGSGIGFCAMHPGWADTAGLASSLPRFHRLMRPALRDPRQGADTDRLARDRARARCRRAAASGTTARRAPSTASRGRARAPAIASACGRTAPASRDGRRGERPAAAPARAIAAS